MSINNQHSVCGYCKNISHHSLFHATDIWGNQYSINRCPTCSALFLAPRPDNDLLKLAYDNSYYGEEEEKFRNSGIEKAIDFFRFRRSKRISRFLRDGDRILDIGCGNGKFLKSLLRFGKYELHGTELDGNSANRAKRIEEINLKITTLRAEDYPAEYFRVITMFHVFEHLTEPEYVLDIIGSILKKEGILVISFPNIGSCQARIFEGNWFHLDPPRHLFFFESDTFIELLKKKGYKLLGYRQLSIEQNPYGMVQSILNVLNSKRELLYESLKGNHKYAANISRFNLISQYAFFIISIPFFVFTDIIASLFRKSATIEFTFMKKG